MILLEGFDEIIAFRPVNPAHRQKIAPGFNTVRLANLWGLSCLEAVVAGDIVSGQASADICFAEIMGDDVAAIGVIRFPELAEIMG